MNNKKLKLINEKVDRYTIQKSHPLLYLSELSLGELKILDVYLGRINSKKADERTVVFEKGELEKLFGVKRIRPEVLDKRMDNIMTTVNIPNENSRTGYTKISLFEKAHLETDDKGIWSVELTCTQTAKKYIFNVDEIGYIQYKLHNVLKLKSKYAYQMFIYLEHNRFRKEWSINVEELKNILDCKKEAYEEYKYFNNLILKKVQKELHEKTDCRYAYEPVKKGRKVVKIKFTLESRNTYLTDDYDYIIPEQILENDNELWMEALKPLNIDLNKEQLDELGSLLVTLPKYKLPQSPANMDNIELQRYHYIDIKVKEILRRNKEKTINNKYMYLLSILKKDAEQ